MLYDNGLLLSLYSSAWQISGEALFARIVEQTAGWVMREMQSPKGGFTRHWMPIRNIKKASSTSGNVTKCEHC